MSDRATWQFRLSDLFTMTTLSAVGAAVAAACGPGTLFLSGGAMLAYANRRGALAALQRGRRQVILLVLAWCVFLTSLALPSIQVFGPVQGWRAAWFAIAAPMEAVRGGQFLEPSLLWYVGCDVANGLMLLVPLLIWRLRGGRGEWLGAFLCVAMVVPWSVGWNTPMLVGYYVWCGAFYLALCALPVRRPTLAAMVTLAVLLGMAAEWGHRWR